jgi:ribosome maturation protein Sdo1
MGKPSQQQLDTIFGTVNDVAVMAIVLEKGVMQAAEAIHSGGTTNTTRGSAVVNTRGKGNTGI